MVSTSIEDEEYEVQLLSLSTECVIFRAFIRLRFRR